jgi:transposase
VHHSKPVKAWVEERKDKIELFYLPSYSPELNPEERLNADLKHAIGTQVPARTKAKLNFHSPWPAAVAKRRVTSCFMCSGPSPHWPWC